LFNQGVLGHEDAGSLSLYTSGSSVLLHALGAGADNARPNRQQGVWAVPAADTADFLTGATSPGPAAGAVTDAYAHPNDIAPKAGLSRLMRDSAGREITHHRDIRLRNSDGAHFVLDSFTFGEAGDYTVGPVWHAQTIIGTDGATHVLAQDNAQLDTAGARAASAPASLRLDFAASAAAGPLSLIRETYSPGRHPQSEHFATVSTGARAAGETVSILTVLRPGAPAAPDAINVAERHADYIADDTRLIINPGDIPSLMSFTPAEITIGGTVTLAGENLSAVTSVKFGNIEVPAGAWSIAGDAAITVTAVPDGIPENGHITVSSLSYSSASVTGYTIAAAPAALAPLEDQTVSAGKNLTLTAAATGNPAPVFQWQVSTDGGATWQDIDGATGATLVVENTTVAMNGWQYRYTATNHAGTQTGAPITLTVREAWFNTPVAIAADAAGNLYLADAADATIRAVTRDGAVYVFAGISGVSGTTTGPRGTARLGSPAGVSIAPGKTLRVTDARYHLIRSVNADGSIAPFVGSPGNAALVDGFAAAARFNAPTAIVTGGNGSSYVADTGNHAIRRVSIDSHDGGRVVTLAGTGAAGTANASIGTNAAFNNPRGLALDEVNNLLYIADTGNHVIRKIDLSNSNHPVTLFAGAFAGAGDADGALADARFDSPTGLVLDGGDLYVADTGNATIRRIADGQVTTIAGAARRPGLADSAPGAAALFNQPSGLALDDAGHLLVADAGNGALRKIAPDDTVTSPALTDFFTPAPPPPSDKGAGKGAGGAPSPLLPAAIAVLLALRRAQKDTLKNSFLNRRKQR
jgi:sugar lactone lactonase YvrE